MLDLSSTKKWPVDEDGLKYVPIKRNYLLRLGIHAQAAERMSAYRAVVRLESDDAISLELTSEKSCEQEILAISPGSRAAADFAREMRAWARRMPSGAETTAEPELEWKTTPSSLETNLTVRFLRAAGIPTTLMPPALALTYRRRRGNAPDEASPSYISVHAGSRTPFRYVITVEPGESANDAIAESLWTDAKAVLELDTRAWDEREQITRSVASQIAVNLTGARAVAHTRHAPHGRRRRRNRRARVLGRIGRLLPRQKARLRRALRT